MTKQQKRQMYAEAWLPELWAVVHAGKVLKTFCFQESAEKFAQELRALGGENLEVQYTK